VLEKGKIALEYDKDAGHYFIIWEPVVIGAGVTGREALEDLRAAGHFCVDSLIDLKLKDMPDKKEE
jgi:hypothetical protein